MTLGVSIGASGFSQVISGISDIERSIKKSLPVYKKGGKKQKGFH